MPRLEPRLLGAIAAVCCVLASMATDVGLYRGSVALSEDRTAVSHVAVGSWAWRDGVRPGAQAIRQPVGGGYDVTIPDGSVRQVGLAPPGLDLMVPVSVALLLAAAAAAWFGMPGASVAAGVAAALAVTDVASGVGGAAALVLAPLPVAAAWGFGRRPRHDADRSVDRVAVTVAFVLVALMAGALAVAEVDWSLVGSLPVVAVAIVSLTAAAGPFVRIAAHRRTGERSPIRETVLAELVPGTRDARLAGIEYERDRLARELHGEVLPALAASIRSLEGGTGGAGAAERLREVSERLRGLMHERQLVILRSAGLRAALGSLVDRVASDAAAPAVALGGSDDRAGSSPPFAVEVAAYRVTQAALDNALRHSGADSVTVMADIGGGRVRISVRDDGVGIDATAVATARARGHVGLAEMEAVASVVGAAVGVTTVDPTGTEVTFEWRRSGS